MNLSSGSNRSKAVRFEGSCMFRERIAASLLSGRAIRIDRIRDDPSAALALSATTATATAAAAATSGVGLQDFEASFLRLVEKIADGCRVEINETGTSLRFQPGLLTGGGSSSSRSADGFITHDCSCSRSIGWYVEGLLPVAVFCCDERSRNALKLRLKGVTNDALDLSVDTLQQVTLPLLQNFGLWGFALKVNRRGAAPLGGGEVDVTVPTARPQLRALRATEEGVVRRVRGVVFSSKVSPNLAHRVVQSCRAVLNHVLPDVHISVDHNKGREAGDSPGYGISLVAETTTGVLLSAERVAVSSSSNTVAAAAVELPEDIGRQAALQLLQEIFRGGVVDSAHQPLLLHLMVLTPEDVSKIRCGPLTPQAVLQLRLLRQMYNGTTFKIQLDRSLQQPPPQRRQQQQQQDESASSDEEEEEEEEEEEDSDSGSSSNDGTSSTSNSSSSRRLDRPQQQQDVSVTRTTVLISCCGIGYSNIYRKAS